MVGGETTIQRLPLDPPAPRAQQPARLPLATTARESVPPPLPAKVGSPQPPRPLVRRCSSAWMHTEDGRDVQPLSNPSSMWLRRWGSPVSARLAKALGGRRRSRPTWWLGTRQTRHDDVAVSVVSAVDGSGHNL